MNNENITLQSDESLEASAIYVVLLLLLLLLLFLLLFLLSLLANSGRKSGLNLQHTWDFLFIRRQGIEFRGGRNQ
jgi:hypothetical protein